ncbi:MAG TPA: ABC transporter permease [Terriglobia bacterium]|nr:ABC transporter permease [Terriglobia bacterium]
MNALVQDLRYALRMLRRNPGFTAVAVLTLALGIGANTAIFSVLDAVLLRPLPYNHPQQLVKIYSRFTGIGLPKDENAVSAPEFLDYQHLNQSFSGIAALNGGAFNIGSEGSPQRVAGATVSPSLFKILGVQPRLGRTFLPEEGTPGHDHEVVLSYGLWQRAFGGQREVLGSTIRVDAVPMTVVGVMPKGFDYPDQSEVWTPLAFKPDDLTPDNRGNHGLDVLARTKPGLSYAQMRSDMDRVGETVIQQHPEYPYTKYGFGVITVPLLEETVGDVRASLWILMGAVGLVLLIACANVASLLLARASGRQKEIAVRVAIGAGPARLARQLLTESTVLALAGGLAGLAFTPWVLHALITLSATALPRVAGTRIDIWALAFTLAVSLATGVLFGLAPALRVRRVGSYDALKSGHTTEGAPSNRLRRALVMGEAALSVLLLAGAGLLLRSFMEVLKVNPGFQADEVLTVRVALPPVKYNKPEQIYPFYSGLIERIRALPGVLGAGAISSLPLSGQNFSGTATIDTHEVPIDDTTPEVDQRIVTPGYFEAMGIPLIRGRFFSDADWATAPPVAIVDETMVKTYWPHEDPIGRRIHIGDPKTKLPWLTVVGVVGHVHNRTLEAPSRTELYWPQAQDPFGIPAMGLAIRTAGDPMALAPTIQKVVQATDPDLPVYRVRTMSDAIGDSLARRGLAMILLAVFSGLALLLASVGIYGVTSYSVNQRQQEIGLRMALGARRAQVLGMVIGQGMRTTLVGLVFGLVAALALTRLMSSLLFDVRPADPMALGGAALLLSAIALLANFIPARRASKVDPMVALRYE